MRFLHESHPEVSCLSIMQLQLTMRSSSIVVETKLKHIESLVEQLYKAIPKFAPSPRGGVQQSVHFNVTPQLTRFWSAIQMMLSSVNIEVNEDYVLDAEGLTSLPNLLDDRRECARFSAHDAMEFSTEATRKDDLRSFVKHMWRLAPVLDLREVEALFRRLPGQTVQGSAAGPQTDFKDEGKISALETALILLILSLGSICGEKAMILTSGSSNTSSTPDVGYSSAGLSSRVSTLKDSCKVF